MSKPLLHVIAGPNGAGKSSLYTATISRLTDAEFVNADLLIRAELGRHATTKAEAQQGQALANARRAALMGEGTSLVTETTFSHPSKLALIEDARTKGYDVAVYHVSLDNADLAVARVEHRTDGGGHGVPEEKIRGRFERNRGYIREAILMADVGFVFDNSILGDPPRRVLTFSSGALTSIAPNLPAWVEEVYADILEAGRLAG